MTTVSWCIIRGSVRLSGSSVFLFQGRCEVNRLALIVTCVFVLLAVAAVPAPIRAAAADTAATPEQIVATYGSLADTILAAKKTEWNLVHSILATTYGHAEAAMADARGKMKAGKDAKPALEKVAALISQMASEGDAAVAGVRKRLLEGGHHHNAAGEQQGIYDEGFVIVTRAAKKVFLDAAGKIGRLGQAPDLAALEAEWQKAAKQYAELTSKGPS